MDGQMPTMESGDVLGHEFMVDVVETAPGFTTFKKGDRIVVPFNINCGECGQCRLGSWSVCQRSNRNAEMAAAQFGFTTAGLFGYSHITGGQTPGADGGTRTRTAFQPQDFKSRASTGFATSASAQR